MNRTAFRIIFAAVAAASASAQAASAWSSRTRGSPLAASRYQVVVQARVIAPFRAASWLEPV